MRTFVELYQTIDRTTKTSEKAEALVRYFKQASSSDASWAVFFLTGRKLRRLAPTGLLKQLTIKLSGLAPWLFQECYDNVGDLAETIALLLPENSGELDVDLTEFVETYLLVLRNLDDIDTASHLVETWAKLSLDQKFIFNKLITGGFRVGVSQQMVIKALANVSCIDPNVVAHRLMGNWEPSAQWYERLIAQETADAMSSTPYPFYLAYPIQEEVSTLGDIEDFQIEWKWDGIRAQVIKRDGQVFIWSRGEELISERFPEIMTAASRLPNGTVLDGEILAWSEGDVLPFALLQQRIGRKTVGKKLLAEVPCIFMAFDILELGGQDIRHQSMTVRRQKLLDSLMPGQCDATPTCRGTLSGHLRVSAELQADSWETLSTLRLDSRKLKVEGVMLKRRDSEYGVGRKRGDWWKWKISPLSIDAVLVYAQRGHGRRASLYSDYTFAVWQDDKLLPIAKAYSGLTDEEMKSVDDYVRKNTLEKFGPVRTVKPGLVFEIAFEGIQHSPRHKSGIAVRFPRIARLRPDKPIEEADTLANLRDMLELYGN
ncbi:MAG: ATP-dependent DNA ligase [Candidatus Melainabacteria bacterium]|nr:ATP-dependent DNA ligase [Candidatus Melainabacteria bacterium]